MAEADKYNVDSVAEQDWFDSRRDNDDQVSILDKQTPWIVLGPLWYSSRFQMYKTRRFQNVWNLKKRTLESRKQGTTIHSTTPLPK
jgi:hypothetical protein